MSENSEEGFISCEDLNTYGLAEVKGTKKSALWDDMVNKRFVRILRRALRSQYEKKYLWNWLQSLEAQVDPELFKSQIY